LLLIKRNSFQQVRRYLAASWHLGILCGPLDGNHYGRSEWPKSRTMGPLATTILLAQMWKVSPIHCLAKREESWLAKWELICDYVFMGLPTPVDLVFGIPRAKLRTI